MCYKDVTYKLLIERTIVNETILYNVSDVIIMMIKRILKAPILHGYDQA